MSRYQNGGVEFSWLPASLLLSYCDCIRLSLTDSIFPCALPYYRNYIFLQFVIKSSEG